MFRTSLFFGILALGPSASAQEPPGALAARFQGVSVAELGNRVAAGCVDRGWSIVERTDYLIVCAEKAAAIGTSSSEIQDFARFNFISLDGVVRIVGEGRRELIDEIGRRRQALRTAAEGDLEDEVAALLRSIEARYAEPADS